MIEGLAKNRMQEIEREEKYKEPDDCDLS